MRGCRVEGNKDFGVYISGETDVSILTTVFLENNLGVGIENNQGGDVTVDRCVFCNNKYDVEQRENCAENKTDLPERASITSAVADPDPGTPTHRMWSKPAQILYKSNVATREEIPEMKSMIRNAEMTASFKHEMPRFAQFFSHKNYFSKLFRLKVNNLQPIFIDDSTESDESTRES